MMASDNIDTMFQEPANRMSRSQFIRRSFGNAQNSSPGSKRGSSRVVKASNVSISPHNIQRRRTTAAHTIRATHAASQNIHPHVPSTAAGSAWLDQPKRPMSWHPGSRAYPGPIGSHVPNDIAHGNPISGFESLAVSGSQPLYEASMGAGSFPQNFDQMRGFNGWDTLATDFNVHYPSYPQPEVPATNPFYLQNPYEALQEQPGLSHSSFAQTGVDPSEYQLPPTAQLLPMQFPANLGYSNEPSNPPCITSKKSKELVGIGLYDNKSSSMLSASHLTGTGHVEASAGLQRSSLGKGLKLEETWQPPGEEPIDEADDYSSDEGEDLPVAPPSQQPQPQVYTGYEDLSNQTFFFDGDDHYNDYIAFNTAMQFCEPKAPDPMSGNFLWI